MRRVVSAKGLPRVVLAVGATTIIASATLASCDGGSRISGPQVESTRPPLPRSLNADLLLPPGNSSGSEPLVWVDQACNGEFVAGTGKQVFNLWFDATGSAHLKIERHYTFDGTGFSTLEGAQTGDESLATGNVFRGAGNFMDEAYVQIDGFPWAETYVDIVTLKSQTAPEANYRKKILFHITWSKPTETPTVTFTTGGTNCDPPVL